MSGSDRFRIACCDHLCDTSDMLRHRMKILCFLCMLCLPMSALAGILAECAELHSSISQQTEQQADCHGADTLKPLDMQQSATDDSACYHCDSHCSSIKNLSPTTSSALVYAFISSPEMRRGDDTCNGYPRSLQRPPTIV